MFHTNARQFLALACCLFMLGGLPLSSFGAADAVAADKLVAQLQSSPADLQAAQAEGRKSSAFCANCHGETGMSRYPEVPNLAAQHPDYLLRQIDAFLTGKRKNEFMQGLMKVLSERDKAAVALFYAAAPVQPATAPGPRAGEGEAYFARLCARCHRDDARGGDTFPRLAGQQREYIRLSLTRYLTQSGERFYAPMTAAVTQLGKDNIDAVADYLSGLK
ncbi:c-type cytochrome [Parazoarcus communis]|jgi:cytochrome c553|nr:c-type cytochrome [Parazoarcus communis]